jgi:hypothetical protein
VVLLAVMAVATYRAASVSITAGEAVAFSQWVRPPLRDIVPQTFDPRNRILENLLIKRSIGLLRLSEFSFRLPALLGEGLFLWVVWKLARRYSVFLVVLALVPAGLALGLLFLSLYLALERRIENLNLSAVCLALAPAANIAFLGPALGVACIFLVVFARRFGWQAATERFGLTAIAAGFVSLILPLSHSHAFPTVSLEFWPHDSEVRRLASTLPRTGRVVIGASPEMIPVIEFYKARYRVAGWSVVPNGAPADCYVIDRNGIAVLVRPGQGGGFRPPANPDPFF